MAAVFPVHSPRALLRAFDLLPVELWGPGIDTALGDARLQQYTCSIVRAGMSFALSPRAEEVEVLLVPHACDSTQGLGSVLLDFARPRCPVLPFYLPRGQGEAALAFLASELGALFEKLAAHTGRRPTEEELRRRIAAEEAADQLFGQLLVKPLPLSNRERYRLLRSREFLPAESFAERCQAALEQAGQSKSEGVPLLLSGIVPEPMEILEALDRLGGRVVADDLACTGRRAYSPGQSAEPFRRLAQSLLSGPPDSTLGASVQSRVDHLTQLVRQSGARAVLFLLVKFCEPEQFYLPALRQALEQEGVRSVVVELHPTEPLPDQALTRIEALLETAR